MVTIKTDKEIQIMRQANRIIAETREVIIPMVKPGISTWEIDQIAEEVIRSKGAIPAFKGYHGFPGTLCMALNDEVVHGIPSKKVILKEGDILGIDMGTIYKGFYGDSAVTVPVGKVSVKAQKLMRVTEECLHKGIAQALPGNRISDIGAAVQQHAESHGFSVVRDFVGHGIGQNLHEDPQIPNYGTKGRGMKIEVGMVIAIEPMINEGTPEVQIQEDGWTAVTKDGMLSAHFEHSIAVTENGPVILSTL